MELNERSKQVRRDTLVLSKANGGYHYGGCFSATEILIALYDQVLGPDDKFILSKGHACWPLYVLLREKGLNPKLSGHPERDEANGIMFTTGSEGHGLPAAVGMALARKQVGKPGRIFVLMGDGECQEGTTWESLLTAAHRKLDNLVIIIDYNEIQGSGFIRDILPIDKIDKIAGFMGWDVKTVDGHSISTLVNVLTTRSEDKPMLIISHGIKGFPISFMSGNPEWHSKWPNPEQEAQILKELE
jgi:transketolase